jgi:hypothetical protein
VTCILKGTVTTLLLLRWRSGILLAKMGHLLSLICQEWEPLQTCPSMDLPAHHCPCLHVSTHQRWVALISQCICLRTAQHIYSACHLC